MITVNLKRLTTTMHPDVNNNTKIVVRQDLPIAESLMEQCFLGFNLNPNLAEVRFIYKGRELNPTNSLEQYGVSSDHNIFVLFKTKPNVQSDHDQREMNDWKFYTREEHEQRQREKNENRIRVEREMNDQRIRDLELHAQEEQRQREMMCGEEQNIRQFCLPADIQTTIIFAVEEASKKYWPDTVDAPPSDVIARELALGLFAKAGAARGNAHDTLQYSLSPRLDMVWHHFILETGPYQEFCKKVIGFFMPHTAHTVNDSDELKNARISITLTMRKQIPGSGEPNSWCWSYYEDGGDDVGDDVVDEPVAHRTRKRIRNDVQQPKSRKVSKVHFDIFVKMMNGKTLTLNVCHDMTVVALKQLIYWREGYPCDTFRLIFSGQNISDKSRLRECQIEHNSTLHLVGLLRGC